MIERLSPIPETLIGFIEQGGWVLVPIFIVTLVMWTLIFESPNLRIREDHLSNLRLVS